MQFYQVNDDAGIKRIGFKAQMSNIEIYGLKAVIDEIADETEEIDRADSLGLVYTSSSEYAMLTLCSNVYYGDFDYEVSHFAMLNDGRGVMICRDIVEQEVYYIIEG